MAQAGGAAGKAGRCRLTRWGSYSKYHARKTTVDGITFDSKKEAEFFCELKLYKRAGYITKIERQVAYELQPAFRHDGKAERAIRYVADFVVTYSDGHVEVIDVKGVRTDVYKLKRKMLLFKYPDMVFREV
ncbi:MAG: DUF1064 domain-containing protein [Bacteroidales bacterium]|nr:DUF1064 domain-containing protein [Bacteroidales bacterium]